MCHDISAALLHDNVVIGHLEEERFTRSKHAIHQFPINSIKKLLDKAHIHFNDINVIVISNENDKPKIIQQLKQYFDFNENSIVFDVCDHHIAHLTNSYCYSNFDHCAALVVDGEGTDADSMTLAKVDKNDITVIKKFHISSSLGYMYELASVYCGFGVFGCGKLMGLASFGTPIDIESYFTLNNGDL